MLIKNEKFLYKTQENGILVKTRKVFWLNHGISGVSVIFYCS